MFAQMHEALILARGVQIIDQDAHPHSPVRRMPYVLQQYPCGLIFMNDVVLNVERSLGMIR